MFNFKKNHSDISSTLPKFGEGSKSANFCLDFLQWPLSRSGFETEQHIGNLKLPSGAAVTFVRFAQPFRQPFPNFIGRGQNNAKFGLIFAFEALQFRNKAHLKSEIHV